MKTSVMDKIRILRSNRRKTDPKKGRAPSVAPVVVPAPPPQPPPAKPAQQWVPVFVLNISKGNTSHTASAIPVGYKNDSDSLNIPIKNSTVIQKSVPVTTSSADAPDTHTKYIIRCNTSDPQRLITPVESVVSPASPGLTHTPGTDPSEQLERRDQDSSDSQVKCVLCAKTFPSLTDMQTHYLSTHKSRRGKDSRKAKGLWGLKGPRDKASDSFASQTSGDGEPCVPDQTSEPSLPVGEGGEVEPKCPVCYIDFPTAEEVKQHMKDVHSYVCSECSSTFYSLFQFTNHKCAKVATKKVKRTRKKASASMVTKLPLKPEVAKIMNSFVQIQPKTKKNSKLLLKKSQRSPTPPSEEAQQPLSVITLVSDGKGPHPQIPETSNEVCGMTLTAPEIAEGAPLPEPVIEVEKDTDVSPEKESTFLPSIETTYSLKDPDDYKKDEQRYSPPITVIETRNIGEAKQYIHKAESPKPKVPKRELIKEKIAQLKRNPHVSLSWRPTLQGRRCVGEDGDYVCGRCNVLCDDMEDYMDHLNDCLTMTSVTLEPVPTPPRRLLKLPCQTVAFGSQDTNHNRYLINRSLIAKLQAFLPHQLPKTSMPHQFKSPTTAPSTTTGQTFRDLLDDDFGYESHESDLQTAGSISPVSPATWQSEATHSGELAVQGKIGLGNSTKGTTQGNSAKGTTQGNIVKGTTQGNGTKGTTQGNSTKGTTQPMVVIPMDSNVNLSVASDHQPLRTSPDQSQCGETAAKSNGSPAPAASPLGLLLDQEDIKMEVEEEVLEDQFEDS